MGSEADRKQVEGILQSSVRKSERVVDGKPQSERRASGSALGSAPGGPRAGRVPAPRARASSRELPRSLVPPPQISRLAYVEQLLGSLKEGGDKEVSEELGALEAELGQLYQASGSLAGLRVPLSLIEHVDGGKSTDSYAKGLAQEARARSQEVKGRVAGLRELQGHLEGLVREQAPDALEMAGGPAGPGAGGGG